ncbi:MAG: hypothetical protein RMJ16_03365 [Thermoguttaceae bacterium]|nr:hypothetical protein [Thermoguttaceae bacterium]
MSHRWRPRLLRRHRLTGVNLAGKGVVGRSGRTPDYDNPLEQLALCVDQIVMTGERTVDVMGRR